MGKMHEIKKEDIELLVLWSQSEKVMSPNEPIDLELFSIHSFMYMFLSFYISFYLLIMFKE